ncbi:glycohydrolase toxin TNT-related protein [Actinophytocola sp.]|uniref:glycohydrolase toxin TNT-related protein n=1 Tax=Actinophytocola sp. TaxID=1872138 RepID=UPI003D6B0931
MGIELPPELTDVAAQAGVAWPEADEEAMARQAQAWREAATSMSTVTTDADTTVRGALGSVRGDTGTAATQHWQTFVEPDSGHLTSTVRGMNDAADRLEHAAGQVGAAKVEIVRNLVSLAQNSDAAHSAAAAGHPMALAGLETAINGTSANVANIESHLVDAVRPASGVDMSGVRDAVDANPGTHGPRPLTGALTDTTRGATDLVANTAHGASNLVGDTGHGAAGVVDGGHGSGGSGPAGAAGNLVGDTVRGGAELVGSTGHGAADLGRGAAGLVGDTGHGAAGLVADTGRGAAEVVGEAGRGAVGDVGHGVAGLVGDTGRGAAGLVGEAGRGAGEVVGEAGRGAVGDTGRGAAGVVSDVGQGTAGVVGDAGRGAAEVVGEAGRAAAGDAAPGPANLVGDAPGIGHGGNLVGDAVHAVAGGAGNVGGGYGDPEITGPVPFDSSWGLSLDEDRPTPPTGQTVQAGFAGGVELAGANPVANLPPAAPVVGGAPAPGASPGNLGGSPILGGGGPAFGGAPGAPAPGVVGGPISGGAAPGGHAPGGARPTPGGAIGGAPGVPAAGAARPVLGGAMPGAGTPTVPGTPAAPGDTGRAVGEGAGRQGSGGAAGAAAPGAGTQRPVPGAPGIGAPGTGAPGTGAPRTGGPGIGGPGSGGPAGGVPGAVAAGGGRSDAFLPEPRKGGYSAAVPPASPAAAAAEAADQDEALALFWVHMFPIGHMPVAADRPARQLPAPPAELDYAAGLRFGPGDHPRADLVDSAERRAALHEGVAPLEPSGALPADSPRVTELAAGHDPLGGENERDWERRYLVRFGSVTPHGISREGVEFAWPPGEQYPEGGSAEAEAEVLEEGAELDRFGRWEGRVFAAAGTPFAQRSLPPAHLELGYRRYRVLRPLPVWRAMSAAWFAQTGGGIRYRTTHSAMELVALGYLADITADVSA